MAALAEEALAARDGKWHNHAIADSQFAVSGTDFDNFAHRLVPQHVAVLHAGNNTVIDMQVGAADRACRYFDNRIAWMLEPGIGDALASYVALAVPGQCPHVPLSIARGCNAKA
jgi:hypothetical protein